jgi:hypothetical protein
MRNYVVEWKAANWPAFQRRPGWAPRPHKNSFVGFEGFVTKKEKYGLYNSE